MPGIVTHGLVASGCLVVLVLSSIEETMGNDHIVLLQPGEFYFQIGGKQAFLLGRNPTGRQVKHFEPLLKWAGESGEKIVRIQVTSGMAPSGQAGSVDAEWAEEWEQVFDIAEANGLYVLPVMGVWASWNDGSNGETWHSWHRNVYNAANGGPGQNPVELFQETQTRKLWLQWLEEMVKRWGKRSNIIGWEIFSELDLVTGSSEAAGTDFINQAAEVIRAADIRALAIASHPEPRPRPITASLAGTNQWPTLFASDALDFIQVHPYSRRLDTRIISVVRDRLKTYNKPVMIGECGLGAMALTDGTIMTLPRAYVGIRHGIWAGMVSGAMNGRMLWWEDGYDQYHKIDLHTKYAHAARPVASFAGDVDFTGFSPLDVHVSADVKGGAIGHEKLVLGWFRDTQCEPPEWPVRTVVGQTVTVTVPGSESGWTVDFYDTDSGSNVVGTANVNRIGGMVTVPLPPFDEHIAFKMH